MTDEICGASKRDGSDDNCILPAGWGTDHVGEGRCKLHGGNAGAPKNNQNATKHGLHSDEHHYYQDLPPEEKEYVEGVAAIIRKRVQKNTGHVDHIDRMLSQEIAIQLHIASRARNHIANESGLLDNTGERDEAAPLLEEVRQYSDSIFQNLKKLGVLDDPNQEADPVLQLWRSFLSSEATES